MRAGDADRRDLTGDRLQQPRPAPHRYAQRLGGDQFGVTVRHGRRRHDQVHPVESLGAVTRPRLDSQLGETGQRLGGTQIRARHDPPPAGQELRERVHACSSRSDEVDAANGVELDVR